MRGAAQRANERKVNAGEQALAHVQIFLSTVSAEFRS
jgi:hypothetical protein